VYTNIKLLKSIVIYILFIILLSIKSLYSQTKSQHINVIKGTVIDNSNGLDIPFANIFNESEKTWVHAQENGAFSIWADKGDTLVVSAIGYFSELIYLTDTLSKDSLIIKLESRTYEIGEAIIKVPKKYSLFKQDVLNLELPKTKLDSVSEALTKTSKQVVKKAEYDRMVDEVFNREEGTLFVLGASIRSRNEKDKRKIKKNRSKEVEQNIIYLKYNREIVKKYTNLDENKILLFMQFCNFSNEFILESNEYEIAEAIYLKLNEYKRQNPNIKNK
jgi:hypothetical protein